MMKLKKVLVLFRPDYARVKPLLDAIGDFSKELDLRVHSYSEWLARMDKDIQDFEKVFLLVEDIEANIELLSEFCDSVENLGKFRIFGLPPDVVSPQLIAWWKNYFREELVLKPDFSVKSAFLKPEKRVLVVAEENESTERIEEALQKKKVPFFITRKKVAIYRDGVNFKIIHHPDGELCFGAVIFLPRKRILSFGFPREVEDTQRAFFVDELLRRYNHRNFWKKSVAFLVHEFASPLQWREALCWSARIRRDFCSEVLFLCEQVGVALENSELAYREARQAGVRFEKVKFKSFSCQATESMQKIILKFVSEKDLREVSYLVDWLVVVPSFEVQPVALEEYFMVDRENLKATSLPNPVIDKYSTCWRGVFCAPLEETGREWEHLMHSVMQYLEKGQLKLKERGSIDEEKCVLCLTCLRSCPFGAVKIEGENKRKKAMIDWSLCQGCGICTSLCPAGAIEIVDLKSGRYLFGPRLWS